MNNEVIVIPAYEPDDKLTHLVATIRASVLKEHPIIVVDDGSGEAYQTLFKTLESEYHCVVLHHYLNLGKGRALKTAMNAVLLFDQPTQGIITVDSDGQHTIADMLACLEAFESHPHTLVLGMRNFDHEVPLRSSFGNKTTRQVLNLLTGLNLQDTQTGLRVIPYTFMKTLMNVSGERFEYEMNMLLKAKNDHWEFIEVPIQTIYLEENKSSHFRVFKDSLSIYATFLKYIISSFSSSAIDILAFMLIMLLLQTQDPLTITLSSFGARFISATFNYFFNKQLVFRSDSRKSMWKYYVLVVIQISVSSLTVSGLSVVLPVINVTLIKILVDMILFFVSFQIQRRYVFK